MKGKIYGEMTMKLGGMRSSVVGSEGASEGSKISGRESNGSLGGM